MTRGSTYKQNVTFLEDLPDIEDIEMGGGGGDGPNIRTRNFQRESKYPGNGILPESEGNKYDKFIRNHDNNAPVQESGMYVPRGHNIQQPEHPPYPPQQHPQNRPRENFNREHIISRDNIIDEGFEQQPPKKVYSLSDGPSCIDVANHIAECPICSKFYNNDKTLYLLIIAIMSIVCVLLLKRVIDM